MAGCAGAVAAAIAVNASDTIVGGGAHQRCAGGDFNSAALAAGRNEGYFRHIHQLLIDIISKPRAAKHRTTRELCAHCEIRNLSQSGSSKKAQIQYGGGYPIQASVVGDGETAPGI
jgi:hypothetical protein